MSFSVDRRVSFEQTFYLTQSLFFEATVNGELLRNQAKLMSSVACAGVPIITVVVGNSYGIESYMMVWKDFINQMTVISSVIVSVNFVKIF
jgi:hypothetical protein